jgi:hypothetical protein
MFSTTLTTRYIFKKPVASMGDALYSKRLSVWRYRNHNMRVILAMVENNKKLYMDGGGEPKETKRR